LGKLAGGFAYFNGINRQKQMKAHRQAFSYRTAFDGHSVFFRKRHALRIRRHDGRCILRGGKSYRASTAGFIGLFPAGKYADATL